MTRSAHELLEPYKHAILLRREAGEPISSILAWLETSCHIKISDRCLSTYLRSWGVTLRVKKDEYLRFLIAEEFYKFNNTDDEELLQIVKLAGYNLSKRDLQRERLSLGLSRKTQTGDAVDFSTRMAALEAFIHTEIAAGRMNNRGVRFSQIYCRQHHLSFSRLQIMHALRRIDPAGVESRKHVFEHRRGRIICPGPNYCWSVDGHDKLKLWGIEIYAAIDTYSRYVPWVYVGVSNRTGISVASQFVQFHDDVGYLPQYFRSDGGSETYLPADIVLRTRQRIARDTSLTFRDCWIWTTSTHNTRIESWWRIQTQTELDSWRKYFRYLSASLLYYPEDVEDRVAFLAVYVRYIREAVDRFVNTWNSHKIRRQKNRAHLPVGKPRSLYYYSQDTVNYAVPVPTGVLQDVQKEFDDTSYDIDCYLPPLTTQWCDDRLREMDLGVVPPILESPGFKLSTEFVEYEGQRIRAHEAAYRQIRYLIGMHIRAGNINPELGELAKPITQRRARELHADINRSILKQEEEGEAGLFEADEVNATEGE